MKGWKGRSSVWTLTAWMMLVAVLAACGGSQTSDQLPAVRLGFFPNVTHAPALVGVADGLFQTELGDIPLQTTTFNAGTEAIEAIFAEALDMTFIGPNPAINAHAQSGGTAIRIIAGSTSGGASLVVNPEIEVPSDLVGRKIASPSLGNTQDVALRAWLQEQGLSSDLEGGGDVSVVPQSNSQSLETFLTGEIDGAWVPEPWATRLDLEGGGKVLVDERDLWPEGRFVTTHLIVRTEFLEANPEEVAAVLRGLVSAIDQINEDPAGSQQTVNDSIEALTGNALADPVIGGAWSNLTFTLDPVASSLRESAKDAEAVALLEPVDLDGIYSLELLNGILSVLGREAVSA